MRTELFPSVVERLPSSEFDHIDMDYRREVLGEYRGHHLRNLNALRSQESPGLGQRVFMHMGLNLFRGKRGSAVSTQAAAMTARYYVHGYDTLSNDAVLFGHREREPDLMAWLTETPPWTVLHIDALKSGFFVGEPKRAVRDALEGTLERGVVVLLDWGAEPIGRFPYAESIMWLHNTNPNRTLPDASSLASRAGYPLWCQNLEIFQVGPLPYFNRLGGRYHEIAARWQAGRRLYRMSGRDAYKAAATLNTWDTDLSPVGLALSGSGDCG